MVEMECCRVTRILLVFWIYTFTNVYGETLCDNDWKFFGGSCYLVREENSTQASAQDYCEMYGSNLASIHSDGEQDFIPSILNFGGQQHQAWIGLTCDSNCMTEQSNWRWVDGSPMDYKEPWGMGEPDSYDPCARLRSDKTWGNSACSSVYYSVCKKPGKKTEESGGGSTTVATPAPSTIPTAATKTTTTTVTPPNMQSDAPSSSSTTKNTTNTTVPTSPQSSSALFTTTRTTKVSSDTERDTSTAVYSANSANPDSTPVYIAAALGGALFVVIIVAVLATLLYCRKKKAMANSDLGTQNMHSSSNGGHTGGYSGLAAAPPSQVDGSVYSYLDDAVTDDAKATQVDGDPQYSAAIPRPTEGSLYGGSIAPYSSTRVAQREVRPAPPGLRNSGGSLNSVPSRPVNSSGAPTTGGIPVYAVPMKKPKVTDDDAGSSIVDNDVYNQL